MRLDSVIVTWTGTHSVSSVGFNWNLRLKIAAPELNIVCIVLSSTAGYVGGGGEKSEETARGRPYRSQYETRPLRLMIDAMETGRWALCG